ncbi:MAG: serine/threonine-protein kinase [Jatrophihabitans sp.]
MSDSTNAGGWLIGDRYRVIDRIGSGGMADVFRAHDDLLERDVAVKVFRTVTTADTAAGTERQRAELLALARLNHPHLITLFDGSVDAGDGHAYLVMELVEGPTLGDRIHTGPLPSEAEVRSIGVQIAEALAYVHAAGMVHRDVKPANILLGAGSSGGSSIRARLSDFGIVRLLGAQGMTSADLTLGTASYLAPEQARGSAVGPPADVYALGLTLIEALSGVRSFDGPTPMEAVIARLDRDPEIPSGLPEPWPGLLRAMTVRDPNLRPSAEQVGQALRTGADSTTGFIPVAAGAGSTSLLSVVSPGPPPVAVHRAPEPTFVPSRAPRRESNTGLIVGLILVLLLLGLGVAVLIATNSGGGSPAPTDSPSSTSKTSPSSRTSKSRAPSTRKSTPTRSTSPSTSTSASSASSTPSTTSALPSTSASTSASPSTPASSPASTSAAAAAAESSSSSPTSSSSPVPAP